jgi:hypothetical protein
MSRDRSITFLHLSDIQFGKNHRFGMKLDRPDEAADTLLHRLLDDLRQLEKDHDLRPDLIVLTGDLAEWGLKREFDAVMEFVAGLAEALALERCRILLAPGNHDMNRKKYEAYFADCASEEIDPQPPYWPKWHFFKRFFDLEANGFHQWCRQYSGKQFIGDTRATVKGDDWRREERVEWIDAKTTFPAHDHLVSKAGCDEATDREYIRHQEQELRHLGQLNPWR